MIITGDESLLNPKLFQHCSLISFGKELEFSFVRYLLVTRTYYLLVNIGGYC